MLGVTEARADTFYAGIHGGFGSLNNDWTFDSYINPYTGTSSASGAVGGIQAGWEHPFQGGSVGVEGDLSFIDLNAGFDGSEGIGVDASLLSSLRLRASLSNGPIKPFLTAGVGLGKFSYTEQGSFFGSDGYAVDTTKLGLVVGGGVDTKISENWSGRLEGLYYLFGQDSGTFTDGNAYTVNSNVFVVRAGLNYSFGH
ncbi:MAG: hypothetical protein ABIN69_15120 [Aestuariivirga sp.]